MPELSRWLFLVGALPMLVLGIAHAVATPLSRTARKGLTPRDPALIDAMAGSHVLLTRRIDVWRAWVGFNLSHSLGVVLFAVVVLAVGRNADTFQAEGPVFLPLAVVVSGAYMLIGVRYWFRTPIAGCALSFGCFLAASVAALAG